MAVYLLDTSVIIDVLNQKRNRSQLLESLILQGDLLGCCSVNITEVYAGMRDHERGKTDLLLNSLDYYEVTREIASTAGLLKRDWAKKGFTLTYTDVTIAAVAIMHNMTLITDNTKHFPMPNITFYPLPN